MRDEVMVGEVTFDDDEWEGAWDDVNDILLPIGLATKARAEEMEHMKGNIFRVVKKSEAWLKPVRRRSRRSGRTPTRRTVRESRPCGRVG